MPDTPDIIIPWPDWQLVRRLGRGSYGSVWEIERNVAGEPERCALKVVSIPPEGDWDGSLGLGYDEGTLSESYGKQADQVLREYQLMASLSHPNVVACRDVAKVSHAGDPGCDVLIRMELLTPLPRWLRGRDADPRLAARVGRDIARALEACEKRGVVHRDVKPANIMVDGYGDFKLGDFGVARTLEGTRTATVAGTQSFMAPEVERHGRYNQTVDIYSLGLVMWWMLDGYRGPFMPAGSIAPGDAARAEAMRLQGEPIPAPDGCPPELARIVLKACAYRPDDRYQSAAEMVEGLDAFLAGRRIPAPEPMVPEPVAPDSPHSAVDENDWNDLGGETVGKGYGTGAGLGAPPIDAGPTIANPVEPLFGKPANVNGGTPQSLGEVKAMGVGAHWYFDVRSLLVACTAMFLGKFAASTLFQLLSPLLRCLMGVDVQSASTLKYGEDVSLSSSIVIYLIEFLFVVAVCVAAYFVLRRVLRRDNALGDVYLSSLVIGIGLESWTLLLLNLVPSFIIDRVLMGIASLSSYVRYNSSEFIPYVLVIIASSFWLTKNAGKLKATFTRISPLPIGGDSDHGFTSSKAIVLGLFGLGGVNGIPAAIGLTWIYMSNYSFGHVEPYVISYAITAVVEVIPTIWFCLHRDAQSRIYAQLCIIILVSNVVDSFVVIVTYYSTIVNLIAAIVLLVVCLPVALRSGSEEKASSLVPLLETGVLAYSAVNAVMYAYDTLQFYVGGFSAQGYWDQLTGSAMLFAIITGISAFAIYRYIHKDTQVAERAASSQQ
ncbi:serine/threonine-protein kinase [Olsenella sp. kh2p3]|uniref:serine/threonine protein kinase n=1 Tax=Olsenella sp. kh2p3 TaxID=1797112 RepID=UPI000919CC17|nr:serine/threonine-protein kinase [Olsenella sp. kh2p3]SFX21964.1 Serine/threonine protein kinase [Olsenella sp. kh2p3]